MAPPYGRAGHSNVVVFAEAAKLARDVTPSKSRAPHPTNDPMCHGMKKLERTVLLCNFKVP